MNGDGTDEESSRSSAPVLLAMEDAVHGAMGKRKRKRAAEEAAAALVHAHTRAMGLGMSESCGESSTCDQSTSFAASNDGEIDDDDEDDVGGDAAKADPKEGVAAATATVPASPASPVSPTAFPHLARARAASCGSLEYLLATVAAADFSEGSGASQATTGGRWDGPPFSGATTTATATTTSKKQHSFHALSSSTRAPFTFASAPSSASSSSSSSSGAPMPAAPPSPASPTLHVKRALRPRASTFSVVGKASTQVRAYIAPCIASYVIHTWPLSNGEGHDAGTRLYSPLYSLLCIPYLTPI